MAVRFGETLLANGGRRNDGGARGTGDAGYGEEIWHFPDAGLGALRQQLPARAVLRRWRWVKSGGHRLLLLR